MINDLESKRVIVLIWTSGHNPVHPGEDVGHVAIEISGIQVDGHGLYISLWPRAGISPTQIADTVPHRLHSLEDDLSSEGRAPEVIHCFYTLDRHAMEDRFEQIKGTLQGWRLLGNLFVREQDTAESCASLAYKILQAGDATAGILPHAVRQSSQLSSAGSSRMFKAPVYSSELTSASAAPNPDALVEILRTAKRNEQQMRPETIDIVYPGETPVLVNHPWCSVM